MTKKRAFISFDYDNDSDLKNLLVGQAKNEDSPFEIADWSVKEAISGDWKSEARDKIKKTSVVIVICGEKTDTATGVSAELKMAQEEKIPYFLLSGRKYDDKTKTNKKPKSAKSTDQMYNWTWDNLKLLINGNR